MNFYQSIADHYHHIFPLNKIQVEFVNTSFQRTKDLKLLDIGCGIGELSFELSKYFNGVDAIDLDQSMIDRAKKDFLDKTDNLRFAKMNMLNIETSFGPEAFDAVICFGNTLVHLNGTDEIGDFFRQCKKVLKKDGKLLFQIINYDRIIEQRVKELPTIENEDILFIRKYNYDLGKNRIGFETRLQIKNGGQVIENSITLYPLLLKEIKQLLKNAGFHDLTFFGNFKKDDLTSDSIPLIVEAKAAAIT